jgi:hypothetical protein
MLKPMKTIFYALVLIIFTLACVEEFGGQWNEWARDRRHIAQSMAVCIGIMAIGEAERANSK